MKHKQLLIASLLLLCALHLSAVQNLNVHPRVGSNTFFIMANVKTLTFGGGTLTVSNRDASTSNFAMAGMGYLNFSDVATSIASSQAMSLLTTYPNPVREVLYINLSVDNIHSALLEIIGVDGKVVLHTYISSPASSISVSSLPKGLYLLRVQNGNTPQITKFIKQ